LGRRAHLKKMKLRIQENLLYQKYSIEKFIDKKIKECYYKIYKIFPL